MKGSPSHSLDCVRDRQVTKSPSFRINSIFFAILSGIFLSLPFTNSNFWILAWFGFVPLFFALKAKSKGKAFLLAYVTGLVFWSGTIYWLIHVTLLGLVILVLYLALYFGIFGLMVSTIDHRPSTIDRILFIPCIWVLLEYLRGNLFTGFPWALLAYSQYQNLPIIQIADITGVWGVSFLVMMVNVTIYTFFVLRSSLLGRVKKCIIPLSGILIILAYGYYKIHEPQTTPATLRGGSAKICGGNHEPRTKVSVIQGNIPQELKWNPGAKAYILDKYLKLTGQALNDNPDLIIWPEASTPGVLGEDDRDFQGIFAWSKKTKIPLLIGAVVRNDEKYFNSAVLLYSGEILGRYDKLHLVPFGEYIPLKKALPFLETVVPIGDISPGRDYTVFEIPIPKITDSFAVLICFEDLFPQLSREFVRRGADFLVNITNDAWYKKTAAAYQHLQASVFRAVENRIFLVRCANTGVSGFIAPDGKIISLVRNEREENIFIDGFKTQEINIPKRPFTLYTRYGEGFIIFCFLFVSLNSIISFGKRKTLS